jgi:thiamine-phosphate pyrophosphorylase
MGMARVMKIKGNQMAMTFKIPKIYPITDKRMANRSTHLSILKELARGGATFVQIRDKSTPVKELLRDLIRCIAFAEKNGITLIVNDRCDLALSSGAMGVHLGQDDLPPFNARQLLGKRVIGFSTHSIHQARLAQNAPIDYLAFGPVFDTSSKEHASPTVGLTMLSRVCKMSSLPVVAIGGIGLEQVAPVLTAGASCVAVISAIMQSPNIALQTERFIEKAMGR